MENKDLIDPYKLLGINCNSTISELKKNYYNLSLLTHPDKGGSNTDFNIVHLAYNYIKKQLNNIKETTYEQLEEEFEEFCKLQEDTKPPCFYEVHKEANDWLNEFNREFESTQSTETNIKFNNPFNSGYGKLMEENEIQKKNDNIEDNDIEDYYISDNLDYNPILEGDLKTKFKREIIEYKEPGYLPDTIINYPLKIKKIDDFSELSGNLKMSDYKKSYQDSNLEEEIKEIKAIKEIKNIDYPKEYMEYNPSLN